MTVPEMRDYVGATSLHFLSFEGMIGATSLSADQFSTSHFSGDYPISIGKRSQEILKLGPGEILPKTTHTPTELATARTNT